MKKNLVGFLSGMVFSLGLILSGMTNPAKVKGFLDIFGQWDYSLAFVMGGAVLFNIIAFRSILKRRPFFSDDFFLPTKINIDKNLVLGSIMFGVGWGLIGICPGPGIVNLVTMKSEIFIFVGTMILGIISFKLTKNIWS